MTPETQALVVKALDDALVATIAEGFKGFLTRPDEGRHEAFMRGLNIAVGLHEQFVSVFKESSDEVQGRDGADGPEDVSATHQAEAFFPKGWKG